VIGRGWVCRDWERDRGSVGGESERKWWWIHGADVSTCL